MRPKAWAAVLSNLIEEMGHKGADSAIRADIEVAWGLSDGDSPFEILDLKSVDIFAELKGWMSPLQPFVRLVVLGALRRMGRLSHGQVAIAACRNSLGTTRDVDIDYEFLEDKFFELGFPAGAAALLVSTSSLVSIKKTLSIPAIPFAKMLKGIPADFRHQIDMRRERAFLDQVDNECRTPTGLKLSRVGLAIQWDN